MRILLLHQYFLTPDQAGGSRWHQFVNDWSGKGHSITVITGMVDYNTGKKSERFKDKYFVKEQLQNGTEVFYCHVSESYNTNFIGRVWAYFSFSFFATICGLFKTKSAFDKVICTSPPLFIGIPVFLISKIKRIPFILEIRDLWPESAIDTGVLKNKLIIKFSFWFEQFIYKNASLIVVLTPAFRDTLIAIKKIKASKILLIPNASDFNLSDDLLINFNPAHLRESLGITNKFVITYVGAHGVANHLEQILPVAKALEKEDIVFLLIGDGMMKQKLKDKSKDLGINNIIFLDPVPKKDIFKYILASDMGATILKRIETFKTVYANKTFDYMACKKPTLLAVDGVSRKLIEEADAGVYVEPENTEDYILKIKMYMSNTELRERQGLNGYKYAKINYDRTQLSEYYLETLLKV